MRFARACAIGMMATGLTGALTAGPAVQAADAQEVTMNAVMAALEDRGAKYVQGALLSGAPHILATMDDQGMSVRLGACGGEPLACQTADFSACRETAGIDRTEALQITNSYASTALTRGAPHVANDGVFGQKLCVRLRLDLHDTDVFDLADVYDWQLTMRDFFEHVEDELISLQSAAILGGQG